MMDRILVNQHWRVMVCLFSGLPWIKWMLVVSTFILILGIPIKFIWDTSAGFMTGGVILMLFLSVNVIFFPPQMLSMISSKQIGFLPGIRKTSFALFLLLNILATAAFGLFLFPKIGISISGVTSISILVSFFLIINVLIGQNYPRALGLVFLSFPIFPHIFELLKDVHPILKLVFELSIWIAFYRHWIGWKPSKHLPNMFGMSQSQMSEFVARRAARSNHRFEKFLNLYSCKASTVAGSLLLGRADGWRSILVSAVTMLAGLLMLLGIFLVVSDVQKFRDFFRFAGQINVFILYTSISYGVLRLLFRNMNKTWLYFNGGRMESFNLLERVTAVSIVVFSVPILLIHFFVSFIMLDWNLYHELIWLTAIYSLMVIAATFYIQLIIYHKTKGSLVWLGWLNILLMITFLGPVIACNVFWVDQKFHIISSSYYLMGLFGVGVFMLRKWVQKAWVSVDFVRVTS